MKRLVVTFLIFSSFIIKAWLPDLIAQTKITISKNLTLEEAVKLALEYHPSLRAARAAVRSSSAILKQSESAYFPSLDFSASGSHTAGAFVFNPAFPPRVQKYQNYSAGVQAQQVIFDFGKTISSVSANRSGVKASQYNYQTSRNTVIAGVQLAYFGLIQAQRVIKVDEETVNQAEKHLFQAKAFYEVGTSPRYDITSAEVDLANANVQLISARNQLRIARIQLDNAMGIHPVMNYVAVDSFTIEPFTMSLDSARQLALNLRPDFRSLYAHLKQNQAVVTAMWSQHLPTLLASGSYTWNGFAFPLQNRWTVGLTLSLPLFQGFGIRAQVQEAQANVETLQANIDELSETISLEVEQYYLNLKDAEERIVATETLITQARENLRLAEQRYSTGVGSALEITDALVSLSNAQITNIQALFDYNSALVQLRQAIGVMGSM
jgi:outer membrane protein